MLGQMYRDININEYYELCTRTEYRQSIRYEYQVQPLLKSYFKKLSDFGSAEKGIGLFDHLDYLKEVYVQIVRPMLVELKSTMRSNNLINEAEMFCTDLEFRMDANGKTREFIGDLAKKQDDVVRNIQETISHLMLHFRKKLQEMARRYKPEAPEQMMRSLALCVYMATYFRL